MSSESDGDRLSDDQWDALESMADWWQDNTMGRRAMLGGTAAMAGAAAFGAGRVSADPPDGNPGVIGTQNDRQDVWIDQADANSVDADQVTSRSLPTWRVYKDGSDVVAVDETETEIARNTDAQTVIQAAVDQANSSYNGTYKQTPVARLDGGMQEFSLSSELVVKEGIKHTNFRFEAASVSTGPAVDFGYKDDSFYDGGFGGRNIYVRDAGDVGVKFTHALKCNFANIVSDSASGVGIRVEGSLSGYAENIHSVKAGSDGFHVVADSKVSNQMTWDSCRAYRAGEGGSGHGWNIDDGTNQTFRGCLAESCANDGWNTTVNGTTYDEVWCESNGRRGILDTGDEACVRGGNFVSNDDVNNFAMDLRGANGEIYGPVTLGSTQAIAIANSTDLEVWGVPASTLFGGEGTRTTFNGVGRNAGDPSSTGDWNGNGREGAVVVDTTNSNVYHYRGGAWV